MSKKEKIDKILRGLYEQWHKNENNFQKLITESVFMRYCNELSKDLNNTEEFRFPKTAQFNVLGDASIYSIMLRLYDGNGDRIASYHLYGEEFEKRWSPGY